MAVQVGDACTIFAPSTLAQAVAGIDGIALIVTGVTADLQRHASGLQAAMSCPLARESARWLTRPV